MPALGPWELVIILLIVVVIFGAGRLAEIGGAVGKSVREFRSATQEGDKDKDKAAAAGAVQSAPAPAGSSAAPAPTAAAAENKCPSCATVNPAGQVFCGQCGTRLSTKVVA